MGRIHNQALIETNLNKCETLSYNVIEKKKEIDIEKRVLLNKVGIDKVMDYIFGKSNENPLADLTEEFSSIEAGYLSACDFLGTQACNSRL